MDKETTGGYNFLIRRREQRERLVMSVEGQTERLPIFVRGDGCLFHHMYSVFEGQINDRREHLLISSEGAEWMSAYLDGGMDGATAYF